MGSWGSHLAPGARSALKWSSIFVTAGSFIAAAAIWTSHQENQHRAEALAAREAQVVELGEAFGRTLTTLAGGLKFDLERGRLTGPGVLWAGRIEAGRVTIWLASPQAPARSGIDTEFANNLLARLAAGGGQEMYDGVAMVRIRKDPFRPGEWLAIRSAAGSELAILEPAETFSPRAPHTERGVSRAYFISSEGTVLAHSLKGYGGLDFANQPVFSQGARYALAAGVRHGRFSAIDGAVVDASFVRIQSLPVVAVLERSPEMDASLGTAIYGGLRAVGGGLKRQASHWGSVVVMLAVFGGLFWLALAWRARRARRAHAQAEAAALASARASAARAASPASAPTGDAEIDALWEALGEGTPLAQGGLILEPMPRRQEAVAEIRRPAPGKGKNGERALPRSVIEPLADSARLERELKRALSMPAHQEQSRQSRDILLSRFEQDLEHVTDVATAADRLTHLVSEMTGCTALYFEYVPHLYRATLEAMAGAQMGSDLAAHGMAFAVSPELHMAALEAREQGQILSVSDHVPLATLLLKRFRTANYCAWAIPTTHTSRRQSPMAGILVVLEPNERLRDSAGALSRAFRTAGRAQTHAGKSQL